MKYEKKIIPVLNGIISLILTLLNVSIVILPITFFAIVKLVVPIKLVRFYCTSILQWLASLWVSLNIILIKSFSSTKIIFEVDTELKKEVSYLLISNHKSWLDTLILKFAFHKKVAFPQFFIKFQIFYVPFIGIICWGLDFLAMKRYTKKYLEKHPEKKGRDITRTYEYCKKLSIRPITIVNFVEGTRYTLEKSSKSDYKHLLNPRSGGIAVILQALSDRVKGVLNTTIIYDTPKENLLRFMCKKTKQIKVKVEFIPIADIPLGDYFNNEIDKKKFQLWLNTLWAQKDKYISKVLAERTIIS